MNYSDGNEARLGDRVSISGVHSGVVVACIDRNEYSADYSSEQWSYLIQGILIFTSFAGLVHYPDNSSEHMALISRAAEV